MAEEVNKEKEIKDKPLGMSFDEAKGFEMLPISKFCAKHGGNVTPQAVSYCINEGKIDFTWLGKERLVVMTDKTKAYNPNPHPSRTESLGADIKRD